MAKRISNTTDITDAWAKLDKLVEREKGAKLALDTMLDAHGEEALAPSMEQGQGHLINLVIGGPAAPVLHAASEAAVKAQKQRARLGTLLWRARRREQAGTWDSWWAKTFPGRSEIVALNCMSLADQPKADRGMSAASAPMAMEELFSHSRAASRFTSSHRQKCR